MYKIVNDFRMHAYNWTIEHNGAAKSISRCYRIRFNYRTHL